MPQALSSTKLITFFHSKGKVLLQSATVAFTRKQKYESVVSNKKPASAVRTIQRQEGKGTEVLEFETQSKSIQAHGHYLDK